MAIVIQLDASSGVSKASKMYIKYLASFVTGESNGPSISTGSKGIGFFGISVTSWCNTARSGPTTAFT